MFDLGGGFFPDGSDDDLESLHAGGVEDKKGKLSVAGNEAEFCFAGRHVQDKRSALMSRWLSVIRIAQTRGRGHPRDSRRDAGATYF
jgi:hypothetical protein